MTTSSEDSPVWPCRYLEEYLTLDEVGKLEGITREAVRQRLNSMGIKPRTAKETSQLRERREISLRAEDIRKAFLQTRDVSETVGRLGLGEGLVRRALGELVPDVEVLARVPRNGAKKYSVDDLVAALREAAADVLPEILSTGSYDAFLEAHPTLPDGRPRPGKQAVMLRFGSWIGALQRAGLPANPHGGPDKEFSEADAVASIVECWRQIGVPTTGVYETWQRCQVGRPSGATVRKLAGNWNPLLVRAWQLVHGVILDQDDEDVTVPESLLPDAGIQQNATPFVPYHAANEGAEVSLRSDLVDAEYNALERAVRSHALIQNAVVAAAAVAGLVPWSPSSDGPAFDIAVSTADGRVFLVEVKSATAENLELQLRIGLGQVLHYKHVLRSHVALVIPVIAIELRPDESWIALLSELGVGLLVNGSISSDLDGLVESQAAVGSQYLADRG